VHCACACLYACMCIGCVLLLSSVRWVCCGTLRVSGLDILPVVYHSYLRTVRLKCLSGVQASQWWFTGQQICFTQLSQALHWVCLHVCMQVFCVCMHARVLVVRKSYKFNTGIVWMYFKFTDATKNLPKCDLF